MNKRFVITIVTVLVIGIAAIIAVFVAKGYTFSPSQKRVVGTGIMSVTSVPDGASVFIDGHLETATNATVSGLAPKEYDIKVVKEGFIPWEKKISVSEGLVTEVKLSLFPALPTIYPLTPTFSGVVNLSLSPDNQKLAFAVPLSSDLPTRQKGGIWVWTMTSQPISFNRSAEPHQIVVSDNSLDFTKAKIRWSSDSKQILATISENNLPGDANQRNFLLSSDQLTTFDNLRDITPTVDATIKSWQDDQSLQDKAQVAAIKNLGARKIASDSATLNWSPDETKFIYTDQKKSPTPTVTSSPTVTPVLSATPTPTPVQAKQGYKVYDLATNKTYDLPSSYSYQWLSDSRHILLVKEGKIAVCDFDGSNVAVIYAGSFDPTSVFPWPDASRLVFLTTFGTPTSSIPNLFGVNLK